MGRVWVRTVGAVVGCRIVWWTGVCDVFCLVGLFLFMIGKVVIGTLGFSKL